MKLLRRIFSSVILLGIAGLLLFKLPSIAGVLVLMGLTFLALLEFYHIQKNSGIPAFRNIGIVSGLAILVAAYVSLNINVLLGPTASDVHDASLLSLDTHFLAQSLQPDRARFNSLSDRRGQSLRCGSLSGGEHLWPPQNVSPNFSGKNLGRPRGRVYRRYISQPDHFRALA